MIETAEQMLAEIAKLCETPALRSDACTVEELAEAWGCGRTAAYDRVRMMVKQGALVHCKRPGGVGMDGRRFRQSAYRLAETA